MSVPTSLLSYQDCLEILDRALEDDFGARLRVTDYDAANTLRARIHYARKLHREQNARTYPPEHPMHGVSTYDALTVRIKTNGEATYVYLERTDRVRGEIEPLSSAPELIEVKHRLQIELKPQALLAAPEAVVKRRI